MFRPMSDQSFQLVTAFLGSLAAGRLGDSDQGPEDRLLQQSRPVTAQACTGPVDKLNSPPPGRPIPSHPSSKLHISPGALTSSRALTLQPLVIGSFLSSASLPKRTVFVFSVSLCVDDANACYSALLCLHTTDHCRLGNTEDFEVLPGVQFRELIDLFEPPERAQFPPTSSPNTSTVLDKSQRFSFVRSVSRLVRQFRLFGHGTVTGISPVFGCAFGTYPPVRPDDLKQDPVASPDTRITSTHKPLACPARNQPSILRLDSAISNQRPARRTNIGTSRAFSAASTLSHTV
ncbi:hypothetical protein CMUS01_05213 [Colletotrichum musicola]|uniref:Uncharacterized protein n=1 Tax=Colletotrichum musicola TaxID=2175873 RepID=A0A8H6KSL4_9PEZI|nr:hypothetical protein CMUS01_05213 [Colletotrichum musicola]